MRTRSWLVTTAIDFPMRLALVIAVACIRAWERTSRSVQ